MSDPQLQSSVDQRPSRYRSVRKAEAAAAANPPSTAQAETIGRSRSRYHHNPPITGQNLPPTSQSPSAVHEQYHDLEQQDSIPSRTLSSREGPSRYHGRHTQQQDTNAGAQNPYVNAPVFSSPEEEEDRTRERRHDYDRARPADLVKTAERYGDPPQNIRAKPEPKNPNKYMNDSGSDEDGGGCFGLMKKNKKKSAMNAATEKKSSARPPTSRDGGPLTIRPGGGGIVPGIDAPVSAVNAGDRVSVHECTA